jgi:predicted enzyme related to lactoylglutathione lyase
MSGPAQAGLSIYAKEMERLAGFYAAMLGMTKIHESPDVTVLQSPDIQMLIHRIPEERADDVVVEKPPEIRDSALKFFFSVKSLEAARSLAENLGGGIGAEQWQGPGFVVCNGHDPEGNVFHIRERRP